jgi:hypothetical protein
MTKPPVFEQLSERQLVRKVTSPEVDGRGGEKKKKYGLPAKKVRHLHSVFLAYNERTRKAAMMRVSRW